MITDPQEVIESGYQIVEVTENDGMTDFIFIFTDGPLKDQGCQITGFHFDEENCVKFEYLTETIGPDTYAYVAGVMRKIIQNMVIKKVEGDKDDPNQI